MITLKKSFELQNYLKSLYNMALGILMCQENVTSTKQFHYRKKAYSEAEDEVVDKPKRYESGHSINDLIDFTCFLIGQMESLTAAINHAKMYSYKDLDGMISMNSQKRKLLERVVSMAAIKPNEVIVKGYGTKFNGEGNQVTYTYDVKEVTTIDFDRNKVKAISGRLRKELDDTSTEIEMLQLQTNVDFNCIFDIGDSFEDAIDRWKENHVK